ncbi:MAG: hypothetical protein B7Y35_05170 [Sphingomonadales bacterium 28-64-96]|nr:MAG: hypothetical protein B7Y35_05170 [Sphingomonadales bacterium 28-64-96]
MHGNAPAGPPLDSRHDVRRGTLLLRPASREVVGPAGTVMVEPKVMQVMLCLAADPAVVTRRQLEQQCWGSQASDEMINRAVAAARRALRTVGAGAELQTIPRTGYRLVLPDEAAAAPAEVPPAPAMPPPRLSRRTMLAAGLAAAGAGAAGLWWQQSRPATDPRLEQVRMAWRSGRPDQAPKALALARDATRRTPDNAAAWGWLALLQRDVAEYGPEHATSAMVTACDQSVRQALTLDARQPQALTALATLPPLFGNWAATRDRLQRVLRLAPDDPCAGDHLGFAEFSMGRVTAATAISSALVAADPLAAVHQHKHVYRLWSMGRLAEMDRVADRALTLWPDHPAVFMARMWTLAFTGRVPAARGMLTDAGNAVRLPPALALLYDQTFVALGGGGTMTRSAAIAGNVEMGRRGPSGSVMAINHLGALGAVDEAFMIANAWLRRQGPLVVAQRNGADMPAINEMRRRKTNMLFLPSAASLRADPRFADLMEGIGLAREWERSGLKPDYQRAG